MIVGCMGDKEEMNPIKTACHRSHAQRHCEICCQGLIDLLKGHIYHYI